VITLIVPGARTVWKAARLLVEGKFNMEKQVSSASLRDWNNGMLEQWNNGFKRILVFLCSTSFHHSSIPSFLSRDCRQANKVL
jgi:hypothetical protein